MILLFQSAYCKDWKTCQPLISFSGILRIQFQVDFDMFHQQNSMITKRCIFHACLSVWKYETAHFHMFTIFCGMKFVSVKKTFRLDFGSKIKKENGKKSSNTNYYRITINYPSADWANSVWHFIHKKIEFECMQKCDDTNKKPNVNHNSQLNHGNGS